jgi:hypothetical protein
MALRERLHNTRGLLREAAEISEDRTSGSMAVAALKRLEAVGELRWISSELHKQRMDKLVTRVVDATATVRTMASEDVQTAIRLEAGELKDLGLSLGGAHLRRVKTLVDDNPGELLK